MRSDILGAGIVLVVIGIFLYFAGNNMIENATWSLFSLDGASNFQHMRSTGSFMVMLGYIFGIVGIILSIAGIFAPTKEQRMKEIVGEQKMDCIKDGTGQEKIEIEHGEKEPEKEINEYIKIPKYCYQCGEKLVGVPKFCYKCGTKLR